jgi:hypothetical protein
MIQAVENLHQRTFACAVLAQQGMNFASFDIEINVIAGKHTGKRLVTPRISRLSIRFCPEGSLVDSVIAPSLVVRKVSPLLLGEGIKLEIELFMAG